MVMYYRIGPSTLSCICLASSFHFLKEENLMRLAVVIAISILSSLPTYGQHKVPGWKPLAQKVHYEKQKNPAKPNKTGTQKMPSENKGYHENK
jgi:hypothetical protein